MQYDHCKDLISTVNKEEEKKKKSLSCINVFDSSAKVNTYSFAIKKLVTFQKPNLTFPLWKMTLNL